MPTMPVKAAGWRIVADYAVGVDPDECSYRAHVLAVVSDQYAATVMERGTVAAFALPLRIGIFEDEAGVHLLIDLCDGGDLLSGASVAHSTEDEDNAVRVPEDDDEERKTDGVSCVGECWTPFSEATAAPRIGGCSGPVKIIGSPQLRTLRRASSS